MSGTREKSPARRPAKASAPARKTPADRVFVVFPCFNEEEGLEKLLHRFMRVSKITGRDFRYVVVNDGSHDHSVAVARSFSDEMPIHIIDFPENRGISDVFNTAFAWFLENASDSDVLITIDSDNTMNPFVTLDMLAALDSADVVIASRFIPGGSMIGAGYRAFLSHVASRLMRATAAIPKVTDYSIFYRAYRVATIRAVFEHCKGQPVSGHGFSAMANLLINLREMNPRLRFAGVPLVLRYDLKRGGSSLKMMRTIYGYLVLAFGREKGGGR